MANKIITIYTCNKCGAQSPKWSGRCLECGGWSTLEKEAVDSDARKSALNSQIAPAKALKFSDVGLETLPRIKTGISELDRVLGGGLVPGSVILLAGEPGIGKSTLVAQIADSFARTKAGLKPAAGDRQNSQVAYVSGEESASQVKARLLRLKCGLEGIICITDNNVEKIISAARELKPKLIIVDSIQTVHTSDADSEAGSISQIRASAVKFLELAKREDIAVILIGHVTKDGFVAGPKTLEHLVDTVIYLESETAHDYRILRASKNRFGSVNEIGIFTMTGTGFEEVKNPSLIFLEHQNSQISGSAVSTVIEGTRPFLVEVQALVTKTVFGYPQRKASGFDLNRLQVLAAVLTKRAGLNLTNQDVILNIVGGMKTSDPALDLAVCLAIASSLLNQVIDRKTVILGEVGLGGEVRNVHKLKERLAEAERLGFTEAYVPDMAVSAGKLKFIKIKNLSEIVKRLS